MYGIPNSKTSKNNVCMLYQLTKQDILDQTNLKGIWDMSYTMNDNLIYGAGCIGINDCEFCNEQDIEKIFHESKVLVDVI